ncbi:hypothetical protein SprV_0100232300 [Sparganum proliferum]
MDAYREERCGTRIAYRTDGHLLNQRRMHFQSRLSTTTVHELLFADDCALNTTSGEDMQRGMDLFSATCESFGLSINTEKTVVMHQPPPNTPSPNIVPQMSVNGTQVQVVDNFQHSFESSWTPAQHEAEDIQGRHPPDAALRSRDLDGVHETGTPTQPLPPQLSSSHPEAEVQNRIPDTDVLKRTGILSIYTMPRQLQLRWSGHLVRMDNERQSKRHFYGDVAMGSRRQGGQIRRYKDTLKSFLKRLQISPTNWKDFARDRPTCRRTVNTGAAIYEVNRIAAAKAKSEARKSQLRPPRNTNVPPPPTCPKCQRTFRARIGPVGHLRINCTTRTATTVVPPSTSSSTSPPPNKSGRSSVPPFPSSSSPLSSSTSPSYAAPRPAVLAPPTHINTAHSQTSTLPPSTSEVRTRITPALTATAPSPHTSAWSVPCESIAQKLTNQCQPSSAAPASTVYNALALSRISYTYSTTSTSTKTCGRQPPAAPHHHIPLPQSPRGPAAKEVKFADTRIL